MNRRTAIRHCIALVPALAARSPWLPDSTAASSLEELERRHGGRLGVSALNLETGAKTEHRATERFAMCSTFKLLAAAAVLSRVDTREERLDRRIVFTRDRLVTYSPVTERHIGGRGMTIAALCEAAITISDNTAANLLLASFGGPAALTAYARSIGDTTTRLDRIEPNLNEATPGDPRDTTTPAAMLGNLHQLVIGNALSAQSRARLTRWLVANKTGDARIRAGLPKSWRVGDKTGTGGHASTNDVAVAWPPGRQPLLMSVYYAESTGSTDQCNAVLADVARILAQG